MVVDEVVVDEIAVDEMACCRFTIFNFFTSNSKKVSWCHNSCSALSHGHLTKCRKVEKVATKDVVTTLGRMTLGRMTLGRMTLGRMTLGRMALGRMILGRMALGRMTLGRMTHKICLGLFTVLMSNKVLMFFIIFVSVFLFTDLTCKCS
jgi:hypothetical protein